MINIAKPKDNPATYPKMVLLGLICDINLIFFFPNIDTKKYEKVSTLKTVRRGIKIHFKSLTDWYKKNIVEIPNI